MKNYWSRGTASFCLGVISLAVAVCAVIFFFFHSPKQSCTTLRDPSGMPSTVCAPMTSQSPYQRTYLALHQYFLPKASCFISIETGNVDCQPFLTTGYNQSATTTDYSTLSPLSAQPQPYIPPNSAQPLEEWTSTTSTPIFFLGFSFILPPGWHGSVYEYPYGGGTHTLVQRSADTRGFSIDCPPSGKGLEAATKLSTKERSFVSREATYAISFEEWTAPGNDPWIFVIARPLSDNPPTSACVAQGASTDLDIEEAMRAMYESWK